MFEGLKSKIKQFMFRTWHGTRFGVQCFQAYMHYRKLIVIMLTSGIFLSIGVIGVVTWGVMWLKNCYGSAGKEDMEIFLVTHPGFALKVFVVVLLFFCVGSVIQTFFGVAGTYAVGDYCDKGSISYSSVFFRTLKKIDLIIGWGIIQGFVRKLSETKFKNSKIKMLKFIAESTWIYLSFFIEPILAFEDKSLWGAIKESKRFMTEYFGTITGSLVGSGLIAGIFFLGSGLLIGVPIGIVYLWFPDLFHFISSNIFSYLFGVAVLMSCFLITIELGRGVELIAKTILYRHIHGFSTGMIDSKTLEAAMHKEK